MEIYEWKIVQDWFDLKNFFTFKKMMKTESEDLDSKFVKYGLHQNWLGNILYVQINATDADFHNCDYDGERVLQMKLKPIVEYLGSELGWSDYLIPQISNFVDERGEPTMSWGVLFIFNGYSLTMKRALYWILGMSAVLGSATALIYKYLPNVISV